MYECRTVSVSIAEDPDVVYGFLANPANIPQWSTFITAIRRQNGSWLATTPTGEVRITFTAINEHRVLDHDVSITAQPTVHVPMRVLKNDDGSEVVFTVFRLPGMTSAQFEGDVDVVRQDLLCLKQVLEKT